jgi:hypothetical protein
MEFSQWANQHPDWVATHHDRYEYFMHHPEEAERFRAEWYNWRAEQHAEQRAEQIAFADWARQHPEWVATHHDRYEFFMHHPDEAEKFRSEWYEQREIHAAEQRADRMAFTDWASQHPEWVRTHHDQYEYFLHHPEQAEEKRAEWSEWHSSEVRFETWAKEHPKWVESHPDRYDYFLHHPEEADRQRAEWYEWH